MKWAVGGARGLRVMPRGSQEVKGHQAYRIPGDQGVAYRLRGPKGSRGGPTGSQGIKE